MLKEMRRKDRSLGQAETEQVLRKGEYGVLSTVAADGEPYGIPINYVYHNGAIYFHCALAGSKLANISHESRVSFCVVGETQVLPNDFTTNYESAIVFGTACEASGEEKQQALTAIIGKYCLDNLETGVYYIEKMLPRTKVIKIMPSHISGKANKKMPG
ncbi:pyridoxamine 5'-phosphate oxidase family protein [Oscillospiraceae bacterium MB08-C2-2]|nr:pyridoxamine 5'-phosphate oxidase family protein [Oscillospiraceae bacterium MB08-C2-2]